MLKIGVKDAIRLLRETVAEKGRDHVYDGPPGICRYTVEGDYAKRPGCIVGDALHRGGVKLTALEYFGDIEGGCKGADGLAAALRDHGIADISERAVQVLKAAQFKQDSNSPWGDAVDAALDKALNYAEDVVPFAA